MALTLHPNGWIGRAIRRVKTLLPEEAGTTRYTNNQYIEFISGALGDVCSEVFRVGDAPPVVRYELTLAYGTNLYVLPPDFQEFRRAYHLNTTTGLVDWEFVPRGDYDPAGSMIRVEDGGRFLRFVPNITSDLDAEEIVVEYITDGSIKMHQSVSPIYSGDNDTGDQLLDNDSDITAHDGESTMQLTPTSTDNWFVGEYDTRENAFIGHKVRLLGTTGGAVPAGYTHFPVQERRIKHYDVDDCMAYVEPAWLFDPTASGAGLLDDVENLTELDGTGTGRTYVVYEVVPALDEKLWEVAVWKCAYEIAVSQHRMKHASGLLKVYRDKLRIAQTDWANQQTRTTKHYETEDANWIDETQWGQVGWL